MCFTPRIHPGLSPGGFFFFNLNSLLSETSLYVGGLENKNFRAVLSCNLGQHWPLPVFFLLCSLWICARLGQRGNISPQTGHWSSMAKIRRLISAAKPCQHVHVLDSGVTWLHSYDLIIAGPLYSRSNTVAAVEFRAPIKGNFSFHQSDAAGWREDFLLIF